MNRCHHLGDLNDSLAAFSLLLVSDFMMIRSFEDLDVWKRAARLAVDVYKTFVDCREGEIFYLVT